MKFKKCPICKGFLKEICKGEKSVVTKYCKNCDAFYDETPWLKNGEIMFYSLTGEVC